MQEKEKYVVLLWDEMHLQPGVQDDQKQDKVIGLEDWGSRRTIQIADHAIVFYIRCIYTWKKMPIGYGFCNSATTAYQLVRCIKEYLGKLIENGMKLIATVCDQHATNIAAINNLIKHNGDAQGSKYNYFFIVYIIFINYRVKNVELIEIKLILFQTIFS